MKLNKVHQSLVHHRLFFGVDYRFMMLEGVVFYIIFIFLGIHPSTIAIMVAILAFLHPAVVELSKKDPQFIETYLNHLKYQKYYQSTVHPSAPKGRF